MAQFPPVINLFLASIIVLKHVLKRVLHILHHAAVCSRTTSPVVLQSFLQ